MTMNQSKRVDVIVRDDGVAHVSLNRPDKMNALDTRMFEALVRVGDDLRTSTSVRAVVLSGQGAAFCAGLDKEGLQWMVESKDGKRSGESSPGLNDLVTRTHGLTNLFQQAAWTWQQLPVPVIAALHGVAFGGGFQIALGADVRLAASTLRMSAMEVRWGLVPDMAGFVLLPRLLRPDIAHELVYTGRIVESREAADIGLVTRICDEPLQEAMAMAGRIAKLSPDAIRAAKRLFAVARSGTIEQILLAESSEQQALIGSDRQIAAVRAGLARRETKIESKT